MAEPLASNILLGGATVWTAPLGTALPSDTLAFGADWPEGWEKIGFTKTELSLLIETEEMDVEVEEELAAIDRIDIKEAVTLETTLAEFFGDYLKLAFGRGTATTTEAGAGQVGKNEFVVGGPNGRKEKRIWGFEGEYEDEEGITRPARVFIWKATAKINGALTFSRKSGEYPGIPLQVKGLSDRTKAAGQRLFKTVVITAPATS
jgi:hypothetical protein